MFIPNKESGAKKPIPSLKFINAFSSVSLCASRFNGLIRNNNEVKNERKIICFMIFFFGKSKKNFNNKVNFLRNNYISTGDSSSPE
jgi:hypothetical protein